MATRGKNQKDVLIQQNLQRLAEVNVQLSVEAARMRMPLKKILAMSEEEVTIFNGSSQEPMILRIGDIVIGTCELVIGANGKPALKILTINDGHNLSGLERVG